MVTRSKRWCKTKERPSDIWEKFEAKDDPNKRCYMPEFRMSKDDIAYIKESSVRKKVSPSSKLEQIIIRVFSYGMLQIISNSRTRNRPRKGMVFEKAESQRRPKYTIHPAYIRLLQSECQKREIRMSLLIHEVLKVYQERFPIYLLKK